MTVCQEHAVVEHETRGWETCELIPALNDVFLQLEPSVGLPAVFRCSFPGISYPSATH